MTRAPTQAALAPRDLARIVREAVLAGKPVKVAPDGGVDFNMPAPTVADGFDLVDFSKGGR